MKVLIADDERLECHALEKMLQLHFPEVFILPSVYDGVELVKNVRFHLPDIVIVDINMPELNGLDALDILREEYSEMEILIHTAYNDFEYIHQALKMGAADYLMKPVFEEDFKEIFKKVLEKAWNKKEKNVNRQSVKKIEKNMQAVVSDNIMMGILLKQEDIKSLKILQSGKEGLGKTGWILSVSLMDLREKENFYLLLVSRLRNICDLYSIVYHGVLYCLILSEHYGQIPDILHHLAIQYDLTYKAGISGIKNQYSQFQQAVFEADTVRKEAGENVCRFYGETVLRPRQDHFLSLSSLMAELLRRGEWREALARLKNQVADICCLDEITFADQYFSTKMLIDIAKALNMDTRRTGMKWTAQTCVREANEYYLKKVGIAGQEHEGSVQKKNLKIEQWMEYIEKKFQQLNDDLRLPVRKRNPYVDSALNLMKNRYMDEISLEQLSDEVGITQFYLSRLLKQERNQTFMELLTDIRIERALELMEDPAQSVQSISQSVGYTTKYFYQIFRNVMGMSQKYFREALFYPEI